MNRLIGFEGAVAELVERQPLDIVSPGSNFSSL